eukprot:366485-Chlamydomonas_euryale.AAC.7
MDCAFSELRAMAARARRRSGTQTISTVCTPHEVHLQRHAALARCGNVEVQGRVHVRRGSQRVAAAAVCAEYTLHTHRDIPRGSLRRCLECPIVSGKEKTALRLKGAWPYGRRPGLLTCKE